MKNSIKIDTGRGMLKIEIALPKWTLTSITKDMSLQTKIQKEISKQVKLIIANEVIESKSNITTVLEQPDNRIYYMDL